MFKRISILFCIAICLIPKLYAQTDDFQRVRLGFKVSPSIIWLKTNAKGLSGDGVKLGFSYGLIFDYNFSKNYVLGTGLEIAYRGGRMKINGSPDDIPVTYNLQYVQLPVTIKLKTNEIGYFTYFGQIGLETGFNIRGRGTDINMYATSSNKENIRSQIIPFNLALLIQLGAEYSLGGHASILLSAYFSNGFTNIFRQGEINNFSAFSKYDARSNGIGLNIGVLF